MPNEPQTTNNPQEIDLLISHLRSQPQICSENIGGWKREFKSDACLCADYLDAMRKYICGFNANPDFDFKAAFGDKS